MASPFLVSSMDEQSLIEERQRLVDAAKEIFNSAAGEIVLEQLKRNYGFYQPTFNVDPHESAFNEGQRSVVLYLLQLINEEKVQQIKGE